MQNPFLDTEGLKRRRASVMVFFLQNESTNDQLSVKAVRFMKTF